MERQEQREGDQRPEERLAHQRAVGGDERGVDGA